MDTTALVRTVSETFMCSSIRYNMNSARFDAAHFGGAAYGVISSAKMVRLR